MAEADDSMDLYDYNFLMDVVIPLGKTLPAINLRIQNAKLKGQEVAIFNKLNLQVQFARKSWHLEVASTYAVKMKLLVQCPKE